MTLEQAQACSHSGSCDDDVALLVDTLRPRLDLISARALKDELQGYGAWDDDELEDHEQNLHRLVWIAAGDITDQEVMQS